MPGRKFTPSQRDERSQSIAEIQPWQHTTGPVTTAGKNRSKMNAKQHGFDTEVLREFRKSERRFEVIKFEALCKELIKCVKSKDIEELQTLTE